MSLTSGLTYHQGKTVTKNNNVIVFNKDDQKADSDNITFIPSFSITEACHHPSGGNMERLSTSWKPSFAGVGGWTVQMKRRYVLSPRPFQTLSL